MTMIKNLHALSIPAGADFEYSSTELASESPLAGGCAWIEGEIVPAKDARISIFDEGFRFSETTYTSIGVWNGKFFRIDDHIERFLDGVKRMGFESPYSKEEIKQICHKVAAAAELREAFILVCLTAGVTPLGAAPYAKATEELYVYSIPYRWVFSPQIQMDGARLAIARSVTRVSNDSVDATIKNFAWRDLMVAKREAIKLGFDSAILLSSDGIVTEGPGFNVMMLKDGVVVTPNRDCLMGITRRTVMELAKAEGFAVEERDITEQELLEADEVLLSTTAGGITPVINIDGHSLSGGEPGEFTKKIRKQYWDLVAGDSAYTTEIDYK